MYVCSLDGDIAWVVIDTIGHPGRLALAPIKDLVFGGGYVRSQHFAVWLQKHSRTLAPMNALSTAIQYIEDTTEDPDHFYVRMAKAYNAPAATLSAADQNGH